MNGHNQKTEIMLSKENVKALKDFVHKPRTLFLKNAFILLSISLPSLFPNFSRSLLPYFALYASSNRNIHFKERNSPRPFGTVDGKMMIYDWRFLGQDVFVFVQLLMMKTTKMAHYPNFQVYRCDFRAPKSK